MKGNWRHLPALMARRETLGPPSSFAGGPSGPGRNSSMSRARSRVSVV